MDNTSDNLIIDQVELTADVLIQQLIELKTQCHNLRGIMAGVSTPALNNGKGQALTDQQRALLLNNLQRTVMRRHKVAS